MCADPDHGFTRSSSSLVKSRPQRRHVPAKQSHQEPDFTGVVRDMASDGRAIVRHPDGRTFFVTGAWLEESVRVRPKGQQRGVGFGEVVEIIEPSPARRESPCAHHGHQHNACGGCPWMFVDYADQCQAKVSRVVHAVKGLGVSPSVVRSLWSSPSELAYRNRAQLKTDGTVLGYLPKGSHTLVDVEQCPILNSAAHEQLQQLRSQLPNAAWQKSPAQGRPRGKPTQHQGARRKHASTAWHTIDIDDVSLSPRLNQRLPFRQGNSAQNTRMREWLALQCAPLSATTPTDGVSIIELFCGAGNFTEVLAATGLPVLAVEASEECVEALNAKHFPSVVACCADLFDTPSVEAVGRMAASAQVLVLDPPRAGLTIREPLLRSLKRLHTVLYISCDVATWARDCSDFMAAGFELEEVQPLDLFPQTPHVELLTRLVRR